MTTAEAISTKHTPPQVGKRCPAKQGSTKTAWSCMSDCCCHRER